MISVGSDDPDSRWIPTWIAADSNMVSPLKAWDTLCKNDLIAAVSIRKSSCVIVIATAA